MKQGTNEKNLVFNSRQFYLFYCHSSFKRNEDIIVCRFELHEKEPIVDQCVLMRFITQGCTQIFLRSMAPI